MHTPCRAGPAGDTCADGNSDITQLATAWATRAADTKAQKARASQAIRTEVPVYVAGPTSVTTQSMTADRWPGSSSRLGWAGGLPHRVYGLVFAIGGVLPRCPRASPHLERRERRSGRSPRSNTGVCPRREDEANQLPAQQRCRPRRRGVGRGRGKLALFGYDDRRLPYRTRRSMRRSAFRWIARRCVTSGTQHADA